jgi:hypothetical protein
MDEKPRLCRAATLVSGFLTVTIYLYDCAILAPPCDSRSRRGSFAAANIPIFFSHRSDLLLLFPPWSNVPQFALVSLYAVMVGM